MNEGAHFEISVDGVARTHRDVREIAIEAALFHKDRTPTEAVSVRDLREGTVVTIGWKDGPAFVNPA